MIDLFMTTAGLSYTLAATGYFLAGKFWMGSTMALYALSILTVYKAGTH